LRRDELPLLAWHNPSTRHAPAQEDCAKALPVEAAGTLLSVCLRELGWGPLADRHDEQGMASAGYAWRPAVTGAVCM